MRNSIGSVRERRGAAGIEPNVVVRRSAAGIEPELFGDVAPPGVEPEVMRERRIGCVKRNEPTSPPVEETGRRDVESTLLDRS